jgi:hypothetical protein
MAHQAHADKSNFFVLLHVNLLLEIFSEH